MQLLHQLLLTQYLLNWTQMRPRQLQSPCSLLTFVSKYCRFLLPHYNLKLSLQQKTKRNWLYLLPTWRSKQQNRLLFLMPRGGSAVNWWERSPNYNNNNNFCRVNNNGNANNNNANNSNGLAPDFAKSSQQDIGHTQ